MKLGLIGLGSIGSFLKEKIEKDPSLELVGILDVDESKRTVNSIDELLEKKPELVIEAASFEAVKENAVKVLSKTNFLILSVSALAEKETEEKIEKLCKEHKTKIFFPSGAIIGLDGISAVKNQLEKVEIETRKNPRGFGREDKEETVLFEGSARDACKEFPKNVNVSATLSINGIGFDKTKVRIISDPNTKANTHTITASGAFGKFSIKVEAVPSNNPKTSSLAALSAFNLIKQLQ